MNFTTILISSANFRILPATQSSVINIIVWGNGTIPLNVHLGWIYPCFHLWGRL